MKVTKWQPYFKTNVLTGEVEHTQMVYEPLVSPDKKVFCMNFSFPNNYQLEQAWCKKHPVYYTNEFVHFVFEKEIFYLEKFSKFNWCPEIVEIDYNARQIFFNWSGETCNDLLYNSNNSRLSTTITDKFETVLVSQINSGIYKLSTYPHSHYIDQSGVMKTFDFYATCTEDDHFISIERIKGLLGDSYYRFSECYTNDMVDLKLMFKNTLSKYSFWPNDLTNTLYKKYNWKNL